MNRLCVILLPWALSGALVAGPEAAPAAVPARLQQLKARVQRGAGGEITGVDLSGSKVADADLAHLKALAGHFVRALPSYAVPKVLRIMSAFEYTPTHKIKKLPLKEQAFDLERIDDPLYVLLPGESEYVPLTAGLHAEIKEGKYKF